jgi:SAM-dependent methyltransferase
VAPEVPAQFIRHVCGHEDFDDFLRSGAEVVTMLELALHKYFGKSFADFETALDFGCGAGRLLRFIESGPVISGCDIYPNLVDFCTQNFSDATFHCNEHRPPLPYRRARFDLVYSFSVFSHLSQEMEDMWLAELVRVGKPGCVYLLTVCGEWHAKHTLGDALDRAMDAGFYFHKNYGERTGAPGEFPDYYELSFHSTSYVHSRWSEFFDIVGIVTGESSDNYLSGDLAWAPAGAVPHFRPMGQDLVVAVKRRSLLFDRVPDWMKGQLRRLSS